jgi:hypothetical protein
LERGPGGQADSQTAFCWFAILQLRIGAFCTLVKPVGRISGEPFPSRYPRVAFGFEREGGNRNEWLYTVAASNSQIPSPYTRGAKKASDAAARKRTAQRVDRELQNWPKATWSNVE